jgi:very-short-patch-repair endonuclease
VSYFISEKLCQAHGIPTPETEHRFTELRRWRFDFAWVAEKVALEVEGGIFSKKRLGHTSGAGAFRDMEKYSEAAALGWLIIRVTPQQLYDTRTFNWIRSALSHSRCKK